MKKQKKPKAGQTMKPRIVILPGLALVIAASAYFFSDMPLWADILLGLFNAALVYYFFVILKIHRAISDKYIPVRNEERLAHSDAAQYAKEIAAEGIVLLKNEEQLLPLSTGMPINLIGLRNTQMVYNGGGSAYSDDRNCMRLETALKNEGFLLNQDLLNLSYNYLKDKTISIEPLGKKHSVKNKDKQRGGAEFVSKPGNPVKQELPSSILRDTTIYPDKENVLSHAKDFSNIAMITLSRGGGEGYDFDPDDLRLIESERELLNTVCTSFDNVVLLLNTANVMEMGWLKEYPSIKAVLWIGYPGTSGNAALAEILCGKVNPSGRLPDTWPVSNLSAPATNNFAMLDKNGRFEKNSFHYTNAPAKKGYFITYSEGIYVGYRYYETRAAVDSSFCYSDEVVWPFGYGLSYSGFAQEINRIEEHTQRKELLLTAIVTNKGKYPGKETVQVYVTAPYTGRIEKSAVKLVAFAKTELLREEQSSTLTLSIPLQELASFDMSMGKWVLEKGNYIFSLRKDSHTVLDTVEWRISEEISFEETKSLFSDVATEALTREFDMQHRAFAGPRPEDFEADKKILSALKFTLPKDRDVGYTIKDYPPMGRPANLKLRDMRNLPKHDKKWNTFVQQLTLNELCNLCGNGAWQITSLPRVGVPRTIIPDGSTCVSSTVFSAIIMGKGKSGITWPAPQILAATFNPQMAVLEGEGVGREASAMGYSGWYAPSMNCHRTAFNSRNFEYYSEDGFLAGKMAASVIKNVQKHKVIVFIKHFALNEKETNARNQLFTWADEQTMREIYLKPFELAVKEGKALGVMSCFNYIGLTWAGGNKALLTELLREEWGFDGIVVTDACLYPHMDVAQMLYAGGNLSLDTLGGFVGGNGKRRTLLAEAQSPERKVLMAKWLQRAAIDILYTVAKTLPEE
ncbi:MAG: glycoside hydrolase family 3 C-terminal domain-containing protein [Oliverpabstia sp.]